MTEPPEQSPRKIELVMNLVVETVQLSALTVGDADKCCSVREVFECAQWCLELNMRYQQNWSMIPEKHDAIRLLSLVGAYWSSKTGWVD